MVFGISKLINPQGVGYLASVYSSHPGGMELANAQVCAQAATLLEAGLVVFSPIAMGHAIAGHLDTDKRLHTHEFWMPIDERILEKCDYLLVLAQDNWENSTGISLECYLSYGWSIPVYFMDQRTQHIYTIGEWFAARPEKAIQFTTTMASAVRGALYLRGTQEAHGETLKSIRSTLPTSEEAISLMSKVGDDIVAEMKQSKRGMN